MKCVGCGQEAHENGTCINCNEEFCPSCYARHAKCDFFIRNLLGNKTNLENIKRGLIEFVEMRQEERFSKSFEELFEDSTHIEAQKILYVLLANLEGKNSELVVLNLMLTSYMMGYIYNDTKVSFENLIKGVDLE